MSHGFYVLDSCTGTLSASAPLHWCAALFRHMATDNPCATMADLPWATVFYKPSGSDSSSKKIDGHDTLALERGQQSGVVLPHAKPAALGIVIGVGYSGDVISERYALAGSPPVLKLNDVRGDLSEAAVDWLRSGQRGNSSEAMFVGLYGLPHPSWSSKDLKCIPHDADDFKRCMKMLMATGQDPNNAMFMMGVSKEWNALAGYWPSMAQAYFESASCPQDGARKICDLIDLATKSVEVEAPTP